MKDGPTFKSFIEALRFEISTFMSASYPVWMSRIVLVLMFFLLIIFLSSCKGTPDSPADISGCQYGMNNSGQRVFIRCRTRGEAQSDGSSVSIYNGQSAAQQFTIYKGVTWESCAQCK